jgi:hypothetical protein
MKSREEIITSMCYTYRHDFGLVKIDESLISAGMTDNERHALWNGMSQIFDNDIAPLLSEYQELLDGDRIVLPRSREHAEMMLRAAAFYLDHQD